MAAPQAVTPSAASSAPSLAPPPTPAGGLGTAPTDIPVYNPLSDFDFQSMASHLIYYNLLYSPLIIIQNLALQQEFLELDLFHRGLAQFSPEEFEASGITPDQQFLLEYMGDQEVGHAQMFIDMLSPGNASKPCTYAYPFQTVPEFLEFSDRITRVGESGVLGFLAHLDSRASANLISESITVESRQELVLRQMLGLFPMPVCCLSMVFSVVLMIVSPAMVQPAHYTKYAMDPDGIVYCLVPSRESTDRVANLPRSQRHCEFTTRR
jgi:hypothetical protein